MLGLPLKQTGLFRHDVSNKGISFITSDPEKIEILRLQKMEANTIFFLQ